MTGVPSDRASRWAGLRSAWITARSWAWAQHVEGRDHRREQLADRQREAQRAALDVLEHRDDAIVGPLLGQDPGDLGVGTEGLDPIQLVGEEPPPRGGRGDLDERRPAVGADPGQVLDAAVLDPPRGGDSGRADRAVGPVDRTPPRWRRRRRPGRRSPGRTACPRRSRPRTSGSRSGSEPRSSGRSRRGGWRGGRTRRRSAGGGVRDGSARVARSDPSASPVARIGCVAGCWCACAACAPAAGSW